MTDLTRRSDQDSATVRDRDRRHLWHIWSPVRADLARLCLSSGTGHTVRDIDGRSYIDASSLNLSCGYAHPDLVGAVQTQVGRLHGYDISVHGHEISGALAARIAGLMPPELSRTLLTNSGTEGIEAALLIAGMYAQLSGEPRTRVVTFARGYHGSTLLSREMSGLPHLAHPFASPLDVTRIDLPLSGQETRDVAGLPVLVEEFRRALLDVEQPPLAVLIEPLLNVGGGVVLPPGFLTEVRRLCDESGALLVLDEDTATSP